HGGFVNVPGEKQAPSSYLLKPTSYPEAKRGAKGPQSPRADAAHAGTGSADPAGRPRVKTLSTGMAPPRDQPQPGAEQSVVNETGQFYPFYTIVHHRLSKKTPFRVNHRIQDEKVLICKSAERFSSEPEAAGRRPGAGAAPPLGQVRWQALQSHQAPCPPRAPGTGLRDASGWKGREVRRPERCSGRGWQGPATGADVKTPGPQTEIRGDKGEH
ncbi:Hypothetical predicted protein, partial [Marmota monax]